MRVYRGASGLSPAFRQAMVRTQVTTKGTNRTKELQRSPVLRLHIFRVIRAFRGQSRAAKCLAPASDPKNCRIYCPMFAINLPQAQRQFIDDRAGCHLDSGRCGGSARQAMERTQVTTKDTNCTKESQRIPVLRLHIFRVIRAFRGQSRAAVRCLAPASDPKPAMVRQLRWRKTTET